MPAITQYPGKTPETRKLMVRVVDVTPKLATDWLTLNSGNRNSKPTAIEKYTRDMRSGEWLLTGEPVIFDSEGLLRNGQNRLLACIRSDHTFTTLVVWGVEPEAFAEMDRNTPRTLVDVLKIAGVDRAERKVPVLQYIWRETNSGSLRAGGKRLPTVSEAQRLLEQNPDLVPCLDWQEALSAAFFKPAPLGPFLLWRLSQIDQNRALEFFTSIAYGENLLIDTPVHSLRKVLAEGAVNKARRSEYDQDYIKHLVMVAWEYWNEGARLTPMTLRRLARNRSNRMFSKTSKTAASGAIKKAIAS